MDSNKPNQTKVFLSNLPPLLTKDQLSQYLKNYGTVVHIKLLFPRKAFVEFQWVFEAETCRKQLNGKQIQGIEIEASCYVNKTDPRYKIFIKPVPKEVTHQELEQFFQPFGKIYSSKIQKPIIGQTGQAFILFENQTAVQAAIQARDQSQWRDFTISVCNQQTLAQRYLQVEYTKLCIRGFPIQYSSQILHKRLSQFGAIVQYRLIQKIKFGIQKWIGFVCYETHQEAKHAESLNGQNEDGFTWIVTPYLQKWEKRALKMKKRRETQEDWKQRNVFIRNLNAQITEERFKALCSLFGRVESVKIQWSKIQQIGQSGKRRYNEKLKAGYALFKTPQEAQSAVRQIKKCLFFGRPLYAEMWKPKNLILKARKSRRGYQQINRTVERYRKQAK